MLFLLYTLLTCGWVLATFVPTFLDVTTLAIKRSPVRRGWTPGMYMVTWMAVLMDTTLVLMLICFATFHLRMAAAPVDAPTAPCTGPLQPRVCAVTALPLRMAAATAAGRRPRSTPDPPGVWRRAAPRRSSGLVSPGAPNA